MENQLKPLLLNIVDTWTEEKLPYILDYGTLLGAYRSLSIRILNSNDNDNDNNNSSIKSSSPVGHDANY